MEQPPASIDSILPSGGAENEDDLGALGPGLGLAWQIWERGLSMMRPPPPVPLLLGPLLAPRLPPPRD